MSLASLNYRNAFKSQSSMLYALMGCSFLLLNSSPSVDIPRFLLSVLSEGTFEMFPVLDNDE